MVEIDVSALAARQIAALQAGSVTGGTALSETECRRYVGNLQGKTIVITGAASGIGRDLAKIAGSHGAKVAIGDINLKSAQQVASEIREAGGTAFAHHLNVTDWESQRDFFKAAEKEYGEIDIIVPGAGVTEKLGPAFEDDQFDKNGDLLKPITTTFDINMIGVLYSVKNAYYYLRKNPLRKGKALVIIGSMASWFGIPSGPMYSTAKAGTLGLMRSAFFELHAHGIRTAIVCPWFVETGIIAPTTRLALVGLPYSKIEDVTSGIIAAVSHPDQDGTALIIDPSGVLSVPFDTRHMGTKSVYDEFGNRAEASVKLKAVIQDLIKVIHIFLRTHPKLMLPIVLFGYIYSQFVHGKTA